MTDAALDGDGIAVEVAGGIGRHLGVALATYANIFEPDVIVIGGGASARPATCCSTRRGARSARARCHR